MKEDRGAGHLSRFGCPDCRIRGQAKASGICPAGRINTSRRNVILVAPTLALTHKSVIWRTQRLYCPYSKRVSLALLSP